MIRVTVRIARYKTKPITLSWLADLQTNQLRSLWEAEQLLNSLPFCPYRFHINVEQADEGEKS